MAKNKKNGVQDLIGLERFTNYGVKTDKAEIVFFSVDFTCSSYEQLNTSGSDDIAIIMTAMIRQTDIMQISSVLVVDLKGRYIMMIDALYNYRQGDIHSAEFSDEFNALCIPFEESLSEEQIDIFHRILDCVSETAAAEMRAAYKAGFKDGVALMREVQ